MTQAITAITSGGVTNNRIEHGVLIELTLNATTYYISNCYKTITYNGHDYLAMGGFLNISEMQNNLANTNDEIQIALSAIPGGYITAVLDQHIKGGAVAIYRAFFNYNTQEVITGQIYKRYQGILTNYGINEDFQSTGQGAEVTHTIVVTASSIMGVLENRVAGRRTNIKDYQFNWAETYFTSGITTDPSMSRVEALYNSSFDFGRKYTPQAASTVDGGTPVDSGGGGGGDSGGGGGDGGE
jgi:uncharacterized membrane protein YgcG